jgi:hypothetical protein
LGTHVLYGDTESVFIKLLGRIVQEAFQFGEEYCKPVTASNPLPVLFKLEKVYSASLRHMVNGMMGSADAVLFLPFDIFPFLFYS